MTDDEECPHGLDARWCGVCLHGPSKPEPVTVTATFIAKLPGRCFAACTADIEPGDVICKLSNERYVHQRCAP